MPNPNELERLKRDEEYLERQELYINNMKKEEGESDHEYRMRYLDALNHVELYKVMLSERKKSLSSQVGGDHYQRWAIQPIEFCGKNKLGFLEGNVVKYVCRHQDKSGVEDINKAIHYLEVIKDLYY